MPTRRRTVLDEGEQVEAIVYVRDYQAGPGPDSWLSGPTGAMAALAAIPTFILALTPRRLLVLAANNLNAAHSTLLGVAPRGDVRIVKASPQRITLSIDGDSGHTFSVPPVWRRDGAQFIDTLIRCAQVSLPIAGSM